MSDLTKTILIDRFSKTIYEQDLNSGDTGTLFPYGDAVAYEYDEHRRSYTHSDALAVAEFVEQSSWMLRKR